MWEECVQEEERISTREVKLNDNEDQDLESHTKKGRNTRKDYVSPPIKPQGPRKGKRTRRDFLAFECFTCHKMGHIARNCPLKEE